MRRKTILALTWAILAGLSAGTVPAGAGEDHGADGNEPGVLLGGPPAQDAVEGTFLGFRPGEEIRYTLESADGERLGIRTIWGIRLEESGRETGVFRLTEETVELSPSGGSGQGQSGTLMSQTEATAWVNAYGSPTRVRFTTRRNTPLGGIEYTIEYRHEQDRFIKELVDGGKDQDVKLDDYRSIDPETLAGLYLFMPVDAECIAEARRMRSDRGGGGGPPPGGGAGGAGGSGRGGSNMKEPCQGREPVFANPGLLNLTMPALWEAGTGTLEVLAMAPTGVLSSLLLGGNQGGGGSGFSVGGYSLLSGSGPNPFDDAEDAFQMFGLTAEGDMMQLEVGGRTVDAWRLRASPPLESAYVDGRGSIVRLDLPADPETGEGYWIRRLRPNEY